MNFFDSWTLGYDLELDWSLSDPISKRPRASNFGRQPGFGTSKFLHGLPLPGPIFFRDTLSGLGFLVKRPFEPGVPEGAKQITALLLYSWLSFVFDAPNRHAI